MKPKDTKRASTYPLTGGGFVHIDRAILPVEYVPCIRKCFSCQQEFTDDKITPDEGDVWWCTPCMKAWEKEHKCHWENGQPIK